MAHGVGTISCSSCKLFDHFLTVSLLLACLSFLFLFENIVIILEGTRVHLNTMYIRASEDKEACIR